MDAYEAPFRWRLRSSIAIVSCALFGSAAVPERCAVYTSRCATCTGGFKWVIAAYELVTAQETDKGHTVHGVEGGGDADDYAADKFAEAEDFMS